MSEGLSLLVRVSSKLCALELRHVVETMRPLPADPIPGTPAFVLGASLIRGDVTPVVDVAALIGPERPHSPATLRHDGRNIGAARSAVNRFVVVSTGKRKVALAVDDVIGVRSIANGNTNELSPLLDELKSDAISTIETLDAELLLVLRSAALVPESTWQLIESMATQ